MVLSETPGLMAFFDCPRGIGFLRRLACLQHGPDFSGCYSLSNRASQEPDGHRQVRAQGFGWKRIATDLGDLSVRGKIAKFRRSLREAQGQIMFFVELARAEAE
jgi:hypothetical protein